MTYLDSILKSRDVTLPTKVHLVKAMVFPVVMYGCESWTIKKAECQRINAFELWCWRKLLRVPWTARRSNQSVLKHINLQFIKRTAAEAEAPVLWRPKVKSWLIRKDPAAGKDWWQEEKGTTEDEMVEWCQWLSGHLFEQAPGDNEWQGSLAFWSPWGGKELDMTKRPNNVNIYLWTFVFSSPSAFFQLYDFKIYNMLLLFSPEVLSNSLRPREL